MILSRTHIKELILSQGLVSGYGDLDSQLSPNGFDMRLCAVIEITSAGRLGVDKTRNRPPTLGKAWILKGHEERLFGYACSNVTACDPGTPIALSPTIAYYVMTIEEINTPTTMMTKFGARTSLFRLTQSPLEATFGEAGYHGYITALLTPALPGGEVELGARFVQVTFAQLSGSEHYEQQNEANYQGGKLF